MRSITQSTIEWLRWQESVATGCGLCVWDASEALYTCAAASCSLYDTMGQFDRRQGGGELFC